MELPQSRPFGTEGRKPTQDFLSLYSHSTVQQDPRPPSQGGFLKTHDFLQVGKTSAKDESTVEISSTVEKPPPPAPPPSSVQHILPGGIGTDNRSHISYFGQKVPKPEGTIFTIAQACSFEKNDENSNGSSYTGSGFTLWEESAVKKGKTGKENARSEIPISREATVNAGQWASQSSSNNNNSFSSLSYSQSPGLKSQSFMEMIKSAKGSTHDADLDDEDEFVLKKEDSTTTATTATTTHTGEFRVKVDGKSHDQKPNTPRSKHSATEQRRRSKINDRFQMLREIIPHSDQKRDKASFMLEVIEYIQFLQEKVHKYEGPYVGWNQEPAKLAPWRNNHKPAESYVDQARGMKNNGSATALVFSAKLDDKKVSNSPAVESDMSTATTFKRMDHQPGITNKAMPFPMSLQPNCYNSVRNGGVGTPIQPRLASDAAEITTSPPQAPISHTRACTADIAVSNDKLKEQELTVEGGTINISTVYSQGLLNTLTQALQSSGVDLSKARVSVQIDLGKRAAGRSNAPASIIKDNEVLASNQGTRTTRSRDRNVGEDSNQALKKQKTHKN